MVKIGGGLPRVVPQETPIDTTPKAPKADPPIKSTPRKPSITTDQLRYLLELSVMPKLNSKYRAACKAAAEVLR